MNKSKGVSLIELILVIMILGVLSAAILPKFFNLANAAQVVVAENAMHSIQEAIDVVVAMCSAKKKCLSVGSSKVTIDKQRIDTLNGYPDATKKGLDRAVKSIGFDIKHFKDVDGGNKTNFYLEEDCYIEYFIPTDPEMEYNLTLMCDKESEESEESEE